MKKAFVLLSLLTTVLSSTAFGGAANINHIVCTGGQIGVGGVTVTFTGFQTFNITEFNAWGFPLSQQAVMIQDPSFDGETLTFDLRGVLTLTEFRLELYNGTKKGRLSTINGSGNLACSSIINAQ